MKIDNTKPLKVTIGANQTQSGGSYIVGNNKIGVSQWVTMDIEVDYDRADEVRGRNLMRIAMPYSALAMLGTMQGRMEVAGHVTIYDGQSFPLELASSIGAPEQAKKEALAEIKDKLLRAMQSLGKVRMISDEAAGKRLTKQQAGEIKDLINSAINDINKNIPHLIEKVGGTIDDIAQEALTSTAEQLKQYMQNIGIKKHNKTLRVLKSKNDEG